MSGIVGSRLNNRGSGLVGSLGSDGQVFTSAGAGVSAVYETISAGMSVGDITGATALAVEPAATDEMVLSDAGTLKRLDMKHMMSTPCFKCTNAQSVSVAHYTATLLFDDVTATLNVGGTLTTGGRWTPGVIGWYWIHALCRMDACIDDNEVAELQLWKNGVSYYGDGIHGRWGTATNTVLDLSLHHVIYLDADDYVEIKLMQFAGETCTVNPDYNSYQAWRILGAA